MWLQLANLHAHVVKSTDEERAWISEYLAFDDPTSRYKKLGKSDGRVRMFNMFAKTFPAGFATMVVKAAAAKGIDVQLVDKRHAPCAPDASADLGWLRDYQLAAVDNVVAKTRGILHLSTGSGKTECAVGLTLRLPCRWLFVVHRTNLVEQAAERYERRTGLRAGRIADGVWSTQDTTFICATFQTLARGLEKKDARVLALLQDCEGLIVDEAHVTPAASFYRVVMATPNAYYRVGLSGTPLARGDRRSLLAVAALGPVIYRVKTDVLVDAGVLAKPTINMIEVRQQCDKPTWQGVYGEAIVRSRVRNRAVVDAALRAAKPGLVFVKEIAHGRLLEKAFWAAGLKCAFVWGNAPVDVRTRHVRDLVAGRIDVLICSVIFQEGVDIPELQSVVIASGGASVIAALQRIGRGMRVDVKTGKSTFEVHDLGDRGCGCKQATGGTHSGCRWLEKHTNQRLRAYRSEGHEVTMVPADSFVQKTLAIG